MSARCLTAWIRLDDQIAHHPKVLKVGLSAWLYVACIAFAQRFLTDGFIPDDAIPTLCGGVEKPIIHIRKLVTAGLLERQKNGYQVHDYLDFNESAASVKQRREEDRKRKQSSRIPSGIQPDSGRIPAGVLARARASVPSPSLSPSVPIPKEQKQKKKAVPSARPDFTEEQKNVKVITRIAHEVLNQNGHRADAEAMEAIKTLCARRHIAYNSEVVRKALDSAEAQSA